MTDTPDTPPPSARAHVGRAVDVTVRIRATPQQVFDAWAKPDQIAQWFVDSAEGEMRGGSTVTWRFETFGYEMPVPILEAEPGRLIVIGGELPGRLPFLQEITIRAEGGTSVMRLVNSGFREGAEWDAEYEGVDSGWRVALAQLKRWLERHVGARRAHVLAVRPIESNAFDWPAVAPLYNTRAGLTSWLAARAELSREPLSVGSALRLELEGGGTLTGEVLAQSPASCRFAETLVSWEEEGAVIGLKSFLMGPRRCIGLDLSAWKRGPAARAELAPRIDTWADRLRARLG
jgi:uncharacterized protein YndB with AHSA1/START domain